MTPSTWTLRRRSAPAVGILPTSNLNRRGTVMAGHEYVGAKNDLVGAETSDEHDDTSDEIVVGRHRDAERPASHASHADEVSFQGPEALVDEESAESGDMAQLGLNTNDDADSEGHTVLDVFINNKVASTTTLTATDSTQNVERLPDKDFDNDKDEDDPALSYCSQEHYLHWLGGKHRYPHQHGRFFFPIGLHALTRVTPCVVDHQCQYCSSSRVGDKTPECDYRTTWCEPALKSAGSQRMVPDSPLHSPSRSPVTIPEVDAQRNIEYGGCFQLWWVSPPPRALRGGCKWLMIKSEIY